MNSRINQRLAIFLAGILPFMPALRLALPVLRTAGGPSSAWIFKWVVGAAVVGYDAVSSASSVAISPPSAIIGQPYAGTITYAGGFAGSVVSMAINGTCLGTYTIAPGLRATYSSGNTATVSGTPTGTAGTVALSVEATDGSGCGGGEADSRSTSLIIQASGGGSIAPSMVVVPANTVAQVGTTVVLSGGASGNPTPGYYWKQGITPIPNATNNTLTIPSVQLTNAGLYSLYATNSVSSTFSLCYLTVAVTPGANPLAFQYTNYIVANTAITLNSLITNVPAASNGYSWFYNNVAINNTNQNLSLSTAQTTPNKTGVYSVTFNSMSGTTPIVSGQQYSSYYAFGYLPGISVQPSGASVSPGANVPFSFTLSGGNYPNVSLYQNQTNLVWQTNLASYNPNISTATSNFSTTISNVTLASAGSYTFVVTNFWGGITSSPAVLTVNSPLSVPTPQNQTNYAGKSVTLNAAPVGTGPFYFHWQKSGSYLTDGGNLSGSASSNLLFNPAVTNNSGNYQVIVSNLSAAVTSGVAVLDILPVPTLKGVSNSVSSSGFTFSAPGGVVGSNFIVQTSSNLTTGIWTSVQTNVVPANGSISFNATNNNPRLFYRVLFP